MKKKLIILSVLLVCLVGCKTRADIIEDQKLSAERQTHWINVRGVDCIVISDTSGVAVDCNWK